MEKIYYSSALTSFTITITLFLVLKDNILESYLPANYVGMIVEILVGIGIFTLVFTSAYNIILFLKRKNSPYEKIARTKKWYQIFKFRNDSGDQVRHGPVNIEMSDGELNISAISYHLDESFSSSWHTSSCILESNRIIILFGSNGKRTTTLGTMVFTLEGSPVNKLVGNFNDSAPFTNHGDIILYKDKADYEQALMSCRGHKCLAGI